jgi:UDP-N-acetylmuramoyl-L-alanyl-D-glutamate--2,6-diaminopimelate ligase
LKISELVEGMTTISEDQDRFITGLCSDSRKMQSGDCFFALKGLCQEGRDFIPVALEKGASAVIVDESTPYTSQSTSVPVIHLPQLSRLLGEIAARFYHRPADDLIMIGITGTNGKTSTAQYLAMALKMAQTSCGTIGTLGYGFPGNLLPSTHTTSDAITLQKQLADLSQQGAQAVAMEVSSHALEQYRTTGIIFDSAIFTNLTRDHLDFHGNMENYAAAKKRLFYSKSLKQAIINTDDPFGVILAQELKGTLPTYGYGLQPVELSLPMIQAHHIHLNSKGLTAKISSPWGEGQLRSRLLGRFNLSNLLAVLTALLGLELPFDTALDYISNLQTIPGRMQVFGGGKLPLVVVDYAHTPDALMQVLLALQEHTHQGTLWCVFGCGGDRDKGKRPLMGQIAEHYSDQLIITDDNPRSEESSIIIADIMKGLLCPWAAEIEQDRGAAIAHVISCAQPGDVVLVAGRGHETYQIIGNEKIPFSDSEHIQTQLRLKSKNSH